MASRAEFEFIDWVRRRSPLAAPVERGIGDDAAVLAAVLPNPEHWTAAAPPRYVLERRDWILNQMQALGGEEMLGEIDAYPDRRHAL